MTTRPPFPLEEAKKIFPPMWTIYERPKDFYSGYVVRQWFGETPNPAATAHPTLEDARSWVEENGGSKRIPREPNDDPVIVETWL